MNQDHTMQYFQPKRHSKAVEAITEMLLYCYRELEEYARYILRCLQRSGIHIYLTDMVFVHQENDNGFTKGIVYPKESVINGKGIVNPMFFKGFKILDISEGFGIIFSENPQTLGL